MHYDRYGYLWLGTENGLARWDGKNIRVLNNKDAPELLESGRINIINEDDKGRVLIEAEGHPLKYIALTGPFSFSRENQRYCGGKQYHFLNLSYLFAAPEMAGQRALKEVIKRQGDVRTFSDDGISGVIAAPEKIIWFDGKHAVIKDWTTRDPMFLIGKLLFGVHGKELYRIDPDNPHVIVQQGSLYERLMLPQDKNNGPLSIYAFQGPLLADDGTHTYTLVLKQNVPELTLLATHPKYTSDVKIIYNERSRLLTIGTLTSGCYILQQPGFQTLHSAPSPALQSDDGKDIFYAIFPYSKDYILSHKGLIPLRDGLPYKDIWLKTATIAKWGNHFIVGGDYMDVFYDSVFHQGSTIYYGKSDQSQYEMLHNNSILLLHGKELVHHWFTTTKQEIVANCPTPDDEFRCILAINDSIALVGAWRNLFVCNCVQHTLQPIPRFKDVNIRTLHRDRRGTIWIGTYGKGFYSWNGHHITHYPSDKGNNLSVINSFLEDSLGYFWITTNNGLFRYNFKDLQRYDNGTSDKLFYNFYDESDGLPMNEFNHAEPSAIALEDGRVAFSNMRGIVLADPRKMPFINAPATIYIDQVNIDSGIIYAPQSDRLNIPCGTGQTIFNTSTPYAGHPYELQLFYRLSSGNHEWNELPSDGKIIFNGLGKGSYKIEFRIVRSGKDAYSSFAFDVLPFWYETLWARLLFVLILLLLILAGYRVGTQALRRQIAERTKGLNTTVAQLNDTIESLRDSEKELYFAQKQREKFSAMVLHDLQSPLKFLSGIADHLYQRLKTIHAPDLNKLAFDLKLSTRQVAEFSNDYLNWLKSNADNGKEKEWVDARKIMERVCALFTELARNRKNTLQCLPGAAFSIYTIPDYLEIIMRNLVDNANKHTENGQITLTCFEEDGEKKIRITDTGKGIDEAGLRQMNDLFTSGEMTAKSDSLGLQIVHDLLGKCGGSILAESALGKGMMITLSFPAVVE